MFTTKLYVVGVYKHDPNQPNCNVQVRLFRDKQAIGDMNLSLSEEEAGVWKEKVGKFSDEVTFKFKA
jgi:hypothetical protein